MRHGGCGCRELPGRNARLLRVGLRDIGRAEPAPDLRLDHRLWGQGGPWQGRVAYAPTVQAEAGFTANSMHHYGEVLGEPRTDSLSHADVYAGLQTAIAILAAVHRGVTAVARAGEPAILGATDCPFFKGPGGEHFTVATSLVGSRTFPLYLRAMRRADLADDPRFATAAARKAHFTALHHIVQTWILTFSDIGALDAQLDEAKIALARCVH